LIRALFGRVANLNIICILLMAVWLHQDSRKSLISQVESLMNDKEQWILWKQVTDEVPYCWPLAWGSDLVISMLYRCT